MSQETRDTLALTRALISRPSVTPEDHGCQELIAARLQALGFEIEHLPFGEVKNLWARRGQASPVLCFAGHTDVVPPGPLEAWDSDPFVADIRDGYLYGRGAADMKAGLAAMLTACEAFLAANDPRDASLAFLITSDEEGRARDGTKRVVEALQERGEAIDWCVIGEPSCYQQLGDCMRIGRRGSLTGHLTVHGTQGHVAYPQLCDNPIAQLAPALAELYATGLDEGNQHFPPTSFQVVNIHSGIEGASNVTPGELKTRFNLRYSTEWTESSLRRHIDLLLDRHGVNYSLDWHLSGAPFLTPIGKLSDATRQAIHEVTGLEPELSTSGGTSDGRFISPAGADVVEIGPVNTTIHKLNECVQIEDLDKLHSIYLRIMELMLI